MLRADRRNQPKNGQLHKEPKNVFSKTNFPVESEMHHCQWEPEVYNAVQSFYTEKRGLQQARDLGDCVPFE